MEEKVCYCMSEEEKKRWDELSVKGWLNLTQEELKELEEIAKKR